MWHPAAWKPGESASDSGGSENGESGYSTKPIPEVCYYSFSFGGIAPGNAMLKLKKTSDIKIFFHLRQNLFVLMYAGAIIINFWLQISICFS